MKKLILILFIVFTLLTFTACDVDGCKNGTDKRVVQPDCYMLNINETLSIYSESDITVTGVFYADNLNLYGKTYVNAYVVAFNVSNRSKAFFNGETLGGNKEENAKIHVGDYFDLGAEVGFRNNKNAQIVENTANGITSVYVIQTLTSLNAQTLKSFAPDENYRIETEAKDASFRSSGNGEIPAVCVLFGEPIVSETFMQKDYKNKYVLDVWYTDVVFYANHSI